MKNFLITGNLFGGSDVGYPNGKTGDCPKKPPRIGPVILRVYASKDRITKA